MCYEMPTVADVVVAKFLSFVYWKGKSELNNCFICVT